MTGVAIDGAEGAANNKQGNLWQGKWNSTRIVAIAVLVATTCLVSLKVC